MNIVKVNNGSLRGIVRQAEELKQNVNDVSHYAGYFLIAADEETSREISVAINKWSERDLHIIGAEYHHYYEINIVCDHPYSLSTIWSDWEITETQEADELFNKLKEIRDNINEDSFKDEQTTAENARE